MVLEMLLVVPDVDVKTFRSHQAFQSLPWPLQIVPDSRLLSRAEAQFETYFTFLARKTALRKARGYV